MQAPGLLDRPRLDLVAHYLSGDGRRPSPDPHYSTGRLPRPPPAAAARGAPSLPRLAEARAGRPGEIADPAAGIARRWHRMLGLPPAEVVGLVVRAPARPLERLRTGNLGEMVARAAEVEPLDRPGLRSRSPGPDAAALRPPAGDRAGAGDPRGPAGGRASDAHGWCSWSTGRGGAAVGGWRATSPTPSRAGSVDPADIVVVYTDGSGAHPRRPVPRRAYGRSTSPASPTGSSPRRRSRRWCCCCGPSAPTRSSTSTRATLYFAMRTLGQGAGRLRAALPVLLLQRAEPARDVDRLEPALLLPVLRRRSRACFTDSEHLAGELARTYRLPTLAAATAAGAARPGRTRRCRCVTEPPAREGGGRRCSGRVDGSARSGIGLLLDAGPPDARGRLPGVG